eukprot:TRINITY_DN3801_c0_g1_i1.p1 TRINITY_DN3801_c0_g1~~TRINITY_DN3801_c0_g1_i1.p1  ORF type:complete len:1873 (+),score=562.65 TRINITY_DN3801_c0_g1_i1:45-5621(+)
MDAFSTAAEAAAAADAAGAAGARARVLLSEQADGFRGLQERLASMQSELQALGGRSAAASAAVAEPAETGGRAPFRVASTSDLGSTSSRSRTSQSPSCPPPDPPGVEGREGDRLLSISSDLAALSRALTSRHSEPDEVPSADPPLAGSLPRETSAASSAHGDPRPFEALGRSRRSLDRASSRGSPPRFGSGAAERSASGDSPPRTGSGQPPTALGPPPGFERQPTARSDERAPLDERRASRESGFGFERQPTARSDGRQPTARSDGRQPTARSDERAPLDERRASRESGFGFDRQSTARSRASQEPTGQPDRSRASLDAAVAGPPPGLSRQPTAQSDSGRQSLASAERGASQDAPGLGLGRQPTARSSVQPSVGQPGGSDRHAYDVDGGASTRSREVPEEQSGAPHVPDIVIEAGSRHSEESPPARGLLPSPAKGPLTTPVAPAVTSGSGSRLPPISLDAPTKGGRSSQCADREQQPSCGGADVVTPPTEESGQRRSGAPAQEILEEMGELHLISDGTLLELRAMHGEVQRSHQELHKHSLLLSGMVSDVDHDKNLWGQEKRMLEVQRERFEEERAKLRKERDSWQRQQAEWELEQRRWIKLRAQLEEEKAEWEEERAKVSRSKEHTVHVSLDTERQRLRDERQRVEKLRVQLSERLAKLGYEEEQMREAWQTEAEQAEQRRRHELDLELAAKRRKHERELSEIRERSQQLEGSLPQLMARVEKWQHAGDQMEALIQGRQDLAEAQEVVLRQRHDEMIKRADELGAERERGETTLRERQAKVEAREAALLEKERSAADEDARREAANKQHLQEMAALASSLSEERREVERERWAVRRIAAREQLHAQRQCAAARKGGLVVRAAGAPEPGPAAEPDAMVALPGRPLRPFVVASHPSEPPLQPGVPVVIMPGSEGVRLLGELVALVGESGEAAFGSVSVVASRGTSVKIAVTYPCVGSATARVLRVAVHMLPTALCISGEVAWAAAAEDGGAGAASCHALQLYGELTLTYSAPNESGCDAPFRPCGDGLPLTLALRPADGPGSPRTGPVPDAATWRCGQSGVMRFRELRPTRSDHVGAGYSLTVSVRGAPGASRCSIPIPPLPHVSGHSAQAIPPPVRVSTRMEFGGGAPWRDRTEVADAALRELDTGAPADRHAAAPATCCALTDNAGGVVCLAVGGAEDLVRLWQQEGADWRLGLSLCTNDAGTAAGVRCVAWSPPSGGAGSEFLCVAIPGQLLVWEVGVVESWRGVTAQLPAATAHHAIMLGDEGCAAMDCAVDGGVAVVAAVTAPSRVRLWRLRDGAPVTQIDSSAPLTTITAVRLPDMPGLVLTDESGGVVLWQLKPEAARAGRIASLSDAPSTAAVQRRGAAKVDGVPTAACVARLTGESCPCIAVAASDGGLHLLSLPALTPLPAERTGTDRWKVGARISALGGAAERFLVSTSEDGLATVWDLEVVCSEQTPPCDAIVAELPVREGTAGVSLGRPSGAESRLRLALVCCGASGTHAHCVQDRANEQKLLPEAAPVSAPAAGDDGAASEEPARQLNTPPPADPPPAPADPPPAPADPSPAAPPVPPPHPQEPADQPVSEAPAPYLGMQVKDVPGGGGVAVVERSADGPAAVGGLERGDIVTHADGCLITGAATFREVLRRVFIGQQLVLRRIRADGAGSDELLVVVQERPQNRPVAKPKRQPRDMSPMRKARSTSPALSRADVDLPPPYQRPVSSDGASAASELFLLSAAARAPTPGQAAVAAAIQKTALPECVPWTLDEMRNLSWQTFDHTTPRARFSGFLKANGLEPPNPCTESAMRRAVVDHIVRAKLRQRSLLDSADKGAPSATDCPYVDWWRLTRPPPEARAADRRRQ